MINPIYLLFPLISGISTFWLGLLVFLKNRKAKVNQTLFGAIICITIWLLGTFIMFLSKEDYWIIFWDRVVYIGVVFIPITVYHFGLSFIKRKEGNLLYLGYFLSFIFLILSRTDYFVADLYKYSWGVHTQARFFHHIFLVFFVFYILLFFLNIYQYQRGVKGIERIQANYILLAFFILALSSSAFLPAYGIDIRFPFPFLIAFLCVLILSLAIVKYHLFEIKVILTELLVGMMGIILLVLPFLMPSVKLKLLTGFVLFLFILFGYLLIKYTHSEMKRKEEAEALAAKEKVLREEFENLARQRGEMAEQFQVMAIRSEALRKIEEEFARRAEEAAKRERGLREEAERLAKIKTEFLLLSTHHWRTPLSIVKGKLSDILEKEYKNLPEKIWLVLQEIYNANERAIKTANQLIYISQIELGEYSPDLKEADLVSLIKNASIGFKMEARRRGLKFEFKEPKELPKVFVDEEQIKGVLTSLFDNAFRYTLKGKIKIEIEERENFLLTKIKDTGVGIEKEVLPLLFEGLAKGKAGYFYRMEGTGLSLYLAKKLVDLNRGKIWAESEGENKGSTFYLELPVKDNKKND